MAPSKLKPLTLPHSQDMEKLVLGLMINRINCLNVVICMLKEEDFFFTEHRKIFAVLEHLYTLDQRSDMRLIAEELRRRGELESIGGIEYLIELIQCYGTPTFIEEYAKKVKQKSVLRLMIHSCHEIESLCLKDPEDSAETLDIAQETFYTIGQSKNSTQIVSLNALIEGKDCKSFDQKIDERVEEYKVSGGKQGIGGLPSHFTELDNMINGLGASNLIILASRPAMGKTALALNIAINIILKNNAAVGMISLEMEAEQLLERMICSHACVNAKNVQSGKLEPYEIKRLKEVAQAFLQQKNLFFIDDQAGLSIGDICCRARRMKECYNIKLLIIDYLQLIASVSNNRHIDTRQNEVSEIARRLKTLARDLNIPILCLAQLSREVEKRINHRPQLSDLRESGSIEQDSDNVLLLTRPDYYDQYKNPGLATLIVAKNRHGATGDIDLSFKKEFALFENL